MPDPVFVFGSNRCGWHGAGAACFALDHRGARYGQARGRQGNSYGIVTCELRPKRPPVELPEVEREVRTFLAYARRRPDLEFQLTPIGCGLAGFVPDEIAPLFIDAPPNVQLPEEFADILEGR